MRNLIRGFNKKPKQQKGGQEIPNNLSSKSVLYVLDALCEGPIEGFALGSGDQNILKSIYLDETPILNANGSANFNLSGLINTGNPSEDPPIGLEYAYGEPNQNSIIEYDRAYSFLPLPQNKNVKVSPNISDGNVLVQKDVIVVVNSSTYPDADHVILNLKTPSLLHTNSNGDITNYQIRFRIDISVNDGGFQKVIEDRFTGKTTNGFAKSYNIKLQKPSNSNCIWKIRIRRLTENINTTKVQDNLIVESAMVGSSNKFNYPSVALVGMKFDAEFFSDAPERSYDLKLLKVKVPENYNPNTRTYNGIWNGLFKKELQWTDNPAWIFYDLLTNKKHGLGEFVEENNIDKWSLYQIAKYCDELIDGEPRFTCNVFIRDRQEAYQLLQNFSSIFRGMLYWGGGQITFSQDAPKDPVYLFNNQNVVNGTFQYASTTAESRKTVVLVKWVDPDNDYREAIEYIEDASGIVKYGYVETEITAFACTSRAQARRAGEWILKTEQLLTETIVFKVGLEGSNLRPGDTFLISDRLKNQNLTIGRSTGYLGNTGIFLDREVYLESGRNYNITIVNPKQIAESFLLTGSNQTGLIKPAQIETFPLIFNGNYTGNTVNISGGFSIVPPKYSAFTIEEINNDEGKSTKYRTLAISEVEENVVEILGVVDSDSKFTFLDIHQENTIFVPPAPQILTQPSGLSISFFTGISECSFAGYLKLSWSGQNNDTQLYEISGRIDSGDFFKIAETSLTSYIYTSDQIGNYNFYVFQKGFNQNLSSPATGSLNITSNNPFSGNAQLDGGLRIFDSMTNSGMFTGNSPLLIWKFQSGDEGCEEDPSVSIIKNFNIKFLDIVNNNVVYQELLDNDERSYQITLENLNTWYPSNPRTFKVLLEASNFFNETFVLDSGIFTNPPPSSGSSLVWSFSDVFNFSIQPNQADQDIKEIRFWLSTGVITGGFGQETFISQSSVGTYFFQAGANLNYKYAFVDTFGTGGAFIFGPFSVSPITPVMSLFTSGNPSAVGNIQLNGSNNIQIQQSGSTFTFNNLSSGIRIGLNPYTPSATLEAGSNISLFQAGDNITISAVGGGGSGSFDIRDVWLFI